MKVCPSCSSDDWKMLPAIVEQGSTVTHGGAVGIGTFGIGGGVTKSRSKSSLAQRSASPVKPSAHHLILLLGLLPIGVASQNFKVGTTGNVAFGILCLCLSAIVFAGWVARCAKVDKAHRQAIDTWKETKVCMRCGTFFT